MPTSAQNATITWGSTTLTEVTDYKVEAAVTFSRDHGDCGSVVVRALANPIPPSRYGYYDRLTISHGGVVVFQAACVAERVTLEAVTNDVLRYAAVFRIVWPMRSYY